MDSGIDCAPLSRLLRQLVGGGSSVEDHVATMAVVCNARVTAVGDLRFPRYRGVDREAVQGFRAYWESQVTEFIESSPADVKLDRVSIVAMGGLAALL